MNAQNDFPDVEATKASVDGRARVRGAAMPGIWWQVAALMPTPRQMRFA